MGRIGRMGSESRWMAFLYWIRYRFFIGKLHAWHHRDDPEKTSNDRQAFFGVMPVVQLRRADEDAQRAQGQADIGVNVDRPDAAKGGEAGECCEIKS